VFIVVNCVPTLKFIFDIPVIFNPEEEELIKPLILFKFVFIVLKFVLILFKDDNILVPETINADDIVILSAVILFASMSFNPVDDKPQQSI
jgi:hypothetical protein